MGKITGNHYQDGGQKRFYGKADQFFHIQISFGKFYPAVMLPLPVKVPDELFPKRQFLETYFSFP
jgi:hypothetical protein